MRFTDSPRPRARGFTMVELLVGLVIGALLITVVLRMVTGQTRFALVQGAREEVQQNARGALEIVGSELRTASAQGLVSASEREVILMLPRLWGISCGSPAGSPDIVAVFADAPGLTIPTGDGRGLLVRSETDDQWYGRSNDLNAVARGTITGVAPFALGDPVVAPCDDIAVAPEAVAFRFTGNTGILNAVAGSVVVVYELVRYDVAENADGEWWLRRSNGWASGAGQQGFATTMQPLAGPVDPDSVGFEYFTGTPPVAIAAPGTDQLAQQTVRLIRFGVRTLSRSKLDGSIQQQEEGEVTVQLRNW